jgi:hypothetical protein
MFLILYLAGLAVFGAAAALIPAPGYMDAEYYFATAGKLARGNGFVEPFLWNYLSAPPALPAPSHTYWQPLASLISAASMAGMGGTFRAAQIPGVLLAAAIPLLAARTAISLAISRRQVWLAGVLGLLPGFFTPYLVTTDTFALFAAIGGLLFWQVGEVVSRSSTWRWVALGALVALGSLARADGLLLWSPVLYAAVASGHRRLRSLALLTAGFGILMAPWWWRNLAVTGAIFSPGAGRALWLLDYDELFSFPAAQLSFGRWWDAGLSRLLGHRLAAASLNLQSLIVVNGEILLTPFMVIGAWVQRRRASIRAAVLYAGVLFLFMTLAFPFAGSRGGVFHSSAALMPLLYALAAGGIGSAAGWIAPRLHWETGRTQAMLSSIAVMLAAGLTLWAFAGKAGFLGAGQSFSRNQTTYREAARIMRARGESTPRVAVGDPPGFFIASGWSAIPIPNGDEQVLRQAASAYGATWVVLEADHPAGLGALYLSPAPASWLAPPVSFLDPAGRPVYLFRVLSEAAP